MKRKNEPVALGNLTVAAAVMSKGVELSGVRREGQRLVFLFTDKRARTLAAECVSESLEVNPLRFMRCFDTLRDLARGSREAANGRGDR
jgi:hypothetical protein